MNYVDPRKNWWCTKYQKAFHYLGISKHQKICDGRHYKLFDLKETREKLSTDKY